MKILLLITTYKRNNKIIRFLEDLNDKSFRNVKDYLDVLIVDDDPNSVLGGLLSDIVIEHQLNVTYTKNIKNLGQGPNLMNALLNNHGYDYYWMPGDDDRLMPDQAVDLILKIRAYRPAAAALEFRQGKNLNLGTFFDGESRMVDSVDESIEYLIRFGKATSAIISRPSEWALKLVNDEFVDCMYQDKVLAVLVLLESRDRKIFLKTELTAMGDKDFGKLRYSFRVFNNLSVSINYAKLKYNEVYNQKISHGEVKVTKRQSLSSWKHGLMVNFRPDNEICYAKTRLAKELFIYPFYISCKALGIIDSRFEK